MKKENKNRKEWILNIAVNRWQFNRPRCQPKSVNDWIEYYKKNVKPKKYLEMKKQIKEVEEITEEDCVNYIKDLIFYRTFQGFLKEKETVYGILEKELSVKLHPASDDRHPDKTDNLQSDTSDTQLDVLAKRVSREI